MADSTFTRRLFMQQGLTFASLTATAPLFVQRSAMASPGKLISKALSAKRSPSAAIDARASARTPSPLSATLSSLGWPGRARAKRASNEMILLLCRALPASA